MLQRCLIKIEFELGYVTHYVDSNKCIFSERVRARVLLSIAKVSGILFFHYPVDTDNIYIYDTTVRNI